jgi:hypothetical protein
METKAKGSFFLLVIAITVIAIGYLTIGVTVNSIDGTSAPNNLTAENVDTFYSVTGPIAVLIPVIIIISMLLWYISSPERYQTTNKKLEKILTFLDITTYYFAFGLMCYAIVGTISVALYVLFRLSMYAGETGAGPEIGKWILILIGFYLGTAGVGYLFKKYAWDKYQKRKQEKEYVENIQSLPGVTND